LELRQSPPTSTWGVPGGGWGKVDYRTVTSMTGILGFIY